MVARVLETTGVTTVRRAVESGIGDVDNLEAVVFGDNRRSLKWQK